MAPDQTPVADQWSSLTCVMPDCGEALAVRWELYAPLVLGELEPDADPLVPGDAVAGGWRVECLNGHVILVPADPPDGPECAAGTCDHDHGDDLREWRRPDVDRLTALLRSAGKLPAEPDPFDHELTVDSPWSTALAHPAGCKAGCKAADRVADVQRAGDLPPPGRYRVGVNDLDDRLLIGDRIDPPDRP